MTISTEQVYLLNNRMGRVAANVQLGTLIQNAETITASEVPITNGQILVGNGSGVGASVALSGDITITNLGVATIANLAVTNAKVAAAAAIDFSKLAAMTSASILMGAGTTVPTVTAVTGDVTIGNTGVTAIGAGKVTEAMLVTPGTVGLLAQRRAYAVFNPTAVSGDRTIAAHALSATIPIKSFITGAWYWVETTATSASDAGTIAFSLEGANDLVSAIAISDGSNPWDTTAKPVECVTVVETTSTFLKTTASRALTATVAIEALTAGKIHIWVDYMVYT